jgi:hypothetical protein
MVFAALAGCGLKDPQTGKADGSTPPDSLQLIRKLAAIAAQANQAAPADIDADTRLDEVRAGPGLRLTSTYTLVNSKSEGVDGRTFATKLIPAIRDASCKNPELRPLIDQGVVVVLEYRGGDGNPVGTISINRDTCSTIH